MTPTLTPVLQGDRIPTKAKGTFGIVRRPAPLDGVLLDAGPDADPVFLSEEKLQTSLMAIVAERMKRADAKKGKKR